MVGSDKLMDVLYWIISFISVLNMVAILYAINKEGLYLLDSQDTIVCLLTDNFSANSF